VYNRVFGRHYLPNEVAEVVKEVLCLKETPKQTDLLKNDLGMDSIDRICILDGLERKFNLQIPDDIEVKWKKVEDITYYLDNILFGSE
jgi:acyl carrier protein